MPDDFDSLPPETQVELGRMMFAMSREKETRQATLKAVKKIKPDYVLPADQQVDDLRQELAERDEQRAIEAAQRSNKERLETQRRALLDGTLLPGRKFDEDQVKEIEEKIMPKYGIADYEAGAKIYASDMKPAKPQGRPTGQSKHWSFPDIEGLMDDPAKAANDMAYKVIDELRGNAA